MTQQELERELSRITGESTTTIRNRGFSLMEPPDVGPNVIDWDAVYPTEPSRGQRRNPRRKLQQAA